MTLKVASNGVAMPGSDDRAGTSPSATSPPPPPALLAGSISNFLTVIDLGGENIEKIVKKILSDTHHSPLTTLVTSPCK